MSRAEPSSGAVTTSGGNQPLSCVLRLSPTQFCGPRSRVESGRFEDHRQLPLSFPCLVVILFPRVRRGFPQSSSCLRPTTPTEKIESHPAFLRVGTLRSCSIIFYWMSVSLGTSRPGVWIGKECVRACVSGCPPSSPAPGSAVAFPQGGSTWVLLRHKLQNV